MIIARLISSIFVLPSVIFITWMGGIYFALLIGISSAIAAYELSKMLKARQLPAYPLISGILSIAFMCYPYILSTEGNVSILISSTLISIGIFSALYLMMSHRISIPFIEKILCLITPPMFTAGLLSHAIFIRNDTNGVNWILILIVIISMNDSGAFAFGKLIGKIPFFPKISPNKTLEGSLSGVFLGVLGGLIYRFVTEEPEITIVMTLSLTIFMTVFGQMGDLFESGIKRVSGIKDSGNIIPGHGGVMDRIDSFVFTIPVLYYFIQWTAI